MNEEKILARIEELKTQADQLRANLNAVGGAIQDCEFWLEQLKAAQRSVEPVATGE